MTQHGNERTQRGNRDPNVCANCGDRVQEWLWHPVETRVDEADNFEMVAFCSKACHRAWTDTSE